jgi:hypothetical protein
MKKPVAFLISALAVIVPAPAVAQASSFTLVNNTNIDFTKLMVRRFGTQQWLPLAVTPVPVPKSGGRGAAQFSNPDCAFDLQASLPDGRAVVWPGVNLCDTKVVTLNRGANGELWADYQ